MFKTINCEICKKDFNQKQPNNYPICPSCRDQLVSRSCPNCNKVLIYKHPSGKRNADAIDSVCWDCNSNQIPNFLTEYQQNFLNGLMLGDGCIGYSCKKSKKPRFIQYPRLSVTRKAADKNYLEWQVEIFKDFYTNTVKERTVYDKRTDKNYYSCGIVSKTGKVFLDYRNKWYPNDKKIVPRDLVLTPLTLLIWFLDDGCAFKKTNSETVLRMKLSTDGFVFDDVKFLCDLLNDYLDLSDKVMKFNIYKNDNHFTIQACSTIATHAFISKIDDIFPEIMDRKRTWKSFDFSLALKGDGHYGKDTRKK